MPKLNEVLIESVTELSAERDENGEQTYKFNKEAFFNSINKFMLGFDQFKEEARVDKREIAIKCEVDGQSARYCMGDLISVHATIEKTDVEKEKAVIPGFEPRRLWIACIAQISGKAVIQEFQQKKDV